jgi:itaconyl-CoA hydratase
MGNPLRGFTLQHSRHDSVQDARLSESRTNVGIISMKTRRLNQNGEEIASMFRTVMIAKRDSGLGRDYFPKAKTGELTL